MTRRRRLNPTAWVLRGTFESAATILADLARWTALAAAGVPLVALCVLLMPLLLSGLLAWAAWSRVHPRDRAAVVKGVGTVYTLCRRLPGLLRAADRWAWRVLRGWPDAVYAAVDRLRPSVRRELERLSAPRCRVLPLVRAERRVAA